MDKTSSSIPPIILLQFLHMAFPQFAEKGEQGQYLQQVIRTKSHGFHFVNVKLGFPVLPRIGNIPIYLLDIFGNTNISPF